MLNFSVKPREMKTGLILNFKMDLLLKCCYISKHTCNTDTHTNTLGDSFMFISRKGKMNVCHTLQRVKHAVCFFHLNLNIDIMCNIKSGLLKCKNNK